MTSKGILLATLFGILPILGIAQNDTVEIHDSFFSPADITVAEGTQVVWMHMGAATHTTTSGSPCTADGTWDSGSMTNGQTFSYTFNSSGTFPYFCIPHCSSGMTGSVEVVQCNTEEDTISPTACDSYTVPSGDETYTTTGDHKDTVLTPIGCDSTIQIELTIQQSSSSSITANTCDNYTVPSGDETHSTSGTYMDTLTNDAGCDSVITIDLSIDTSSSSLSPRVCDSYTVPSGDETYSTTGTYMDTLTNAAGCDSLISIDLTVVMPDTSVTSLSDTELEVAESGADYQWLDCDEGFAPITGETDQSFQATENGDYAVAVTVDGCTDTSSCHAITDVGILENELDLKLRFYPNPTKENVQVEIPGRQEALDARVRDMNGRLVRKERIEDPQRFKLALGEEAGFYTIELQDEEGRRTSFKVLRQE